MFKGLKAWYNTVLTVMEADTNFREFVDVPKEGYSVKYKPSSGVHKTLTSDGRRLVQNKGTANYRSVTFPRVPDLAAAEHEVTHVYHMRTNNSIEDVTTRCCLDFVAATEALANAFPARNDDWNMYSQTQTVKDIRTGSPLRSVQVLIKELDEELSTSLVDLVDNVDGVPECLVDAIELDSYRKLRDRNYSLGTIVGSLFFADWDTQLSSVVVETGSQMQDDGSVSAVFRISIPAIEYKKRNEEFVNLFSMDVSTAKDRVKELYVNKIEPLRKVAVAQILSDLETIEKKL